MIDDETRALVVLGKNPLFQYERRRMRWVTDIYSLTQFSNRLWFGSAVLALCIWILGVATSGNDVAFENNTILVLLYVSLGAIVVIDLYSAFTIAGSLHRQLHTSHWELIRM